MPKYQKIQALLQAWETYEVSQGDDSLFGFGLWLQQNQRPETPGNEWITHEDKSATESENMEGPLFGMRMETPIHLEGHIARLFGMLGRIQHHMLKQIFEDLPLHSIMEFGMLNAAEFDTPRRTEVVFQHLLDNATGSHMISRLIKQNYLEEFTDPTDKRAKRLRTTAKGKEINHQTRSKLGVLAANFTATLTLEEKQQIAQLLSKLFHYHNQKILMERGGK